MSNIVQREGKADALWNFSCFLCPIPAFFSLSFYGFFVALRGNLMRIDDTQSTVLANSRRSSRIESLLININVK